MCIFVPHLALGPAPLLSIEGYQDGGIRVVCRSSGWYPKPEVLWRELDGRLLSSLAKKDSQRKDGTFDVQADLILKGSSNLSCVIRNSLLDLEKESTIHITSESTKTVNSRSLFLGFAVIQVWDSKLDRFAGGAHVLFRANSESMKSYTRHPSKK